jgi:WD40 repeat protein
MNELFRVIATTALPYAVSSVAWSPDGQWVAAGADWWHEAGGLAAIDSRSGVVRWHVGNHRILGVGKIMVAPDGQRVAVSSFKPGDGSRVRVLDSASGTEIWSVLGSAERLVFSPDSSLIAFNSRESVLANANTGINPHWLGRSMAVPAFSSNSQRLCDGAPDMYDSRSGEILWHLGGHEEWNAGCAFSSNDQDLIHFSTSFNRITVYDAETGQVRSAVNIRFGFLQGTALSFEQGTSIAFSPDRSCVAVLCRKGVGIYSVADGRARFEKSLNFPSSVSPGLKLVFRADSSQIALNWTLADSMHLSAPAVLVLDAKTGATVWQDAADPTKQDLDLAMDIAFSEDGSLIVAGGRATTGDGFVRVYEVGVPVLSRRRCDGPVNQIAVSAANFRVVAAASAGAEPKLNLFRSDSGELIKERTHPGIITSLAVSTDGRSVVTASSDRVVRMFKPESGKVWQASHDGAVNAVVLSADGRRVATASSDKTARLYDSVLVPGEDADSHQPLWTRTHPHGVTRIALSPDGQWVATACIDRNTRILDAATGNDRHPPFKHDGRIRALTISSTGLLGTANDDGTVLVIEGATGRRRHKIEHPSSVTAAALNSKGTLLATGRADNVTLLWKIDGERPVPLPELALDAPIIDLLFDPIDDLLAILVANPIVRIIEPLTGIERYRLIHPKPVRNIAFSPEGALLVTGCDDNIARVFNVRQR